MKDWKACERKIAEILGGVRVPVTGRQRGATPDIQHETLSVEVKSRKSLPGWLLDAMEQARAASQNDQLPVTILHQDLQQYADSLCVLRLEDLAKLLRGENRG